MDLMGSFSSQRVNTFNFFHIRGILGDNSLIFLFDTGAVCPIVGTNNLFRQVDGFSEKKDRFEHILRDAITSQSIQPRQHKVANSQLVDSYPCVCHHVAIENTEEIDFYFDISLENISIPLLGGSFIDDCAYSHAINSSINITAIKERAGESYYNECNILDFDRVVAEYVN